MPCIHLFVPIHLCSHAPCTSVCSPVFPISHGDLGGICIPHMSRGLSRGASFHLSGISVSLGTSIAFQFITVIQVAPHDCGFFLYWTGCLWMSVLL